jgi:hypothetical protein
MSSNNQSLLIGAVAGVATCLAGQYLLGGKTESAPSAASGGDALPQLGTS